MIEHDLDYVRITKAIRYLDENPTEQPSLDALAGHVGLSKYYFHRLFKQWAGLTTPKQFLQFLTVEKAKEPDPEDRRILRIRPSPRGEAINRAIMEDLVIQSVRLLEDLDGASRTAVTGVVRALASSYAAGVEAGGGSCCVIR